MPELPEVDTMRRGLAGLVGRSVVAADFPRSRVRPITVTPPAGRVAAALVGRTITAVTRRGKRVILEFDDAAGDGRRWLVIEPRMTGLMLLVEPPTAEHVRLVVRLSGPAARGRARTTNPADERLLFWDRRGLGTVRLCDAAELEARCGAAALGPDGLVVRGDELALRLGRSRRSVKAALLDQRAVAGIGNIYASEILFRAGIDPRTRCRRLPAAAWDRIAAATRRVLGEAVRCEGSSIGDETYRTVRSRPGRFQRRHRVYGRAGQPCRGCGTPIERIVLAQRSTFFCPRCQPR